MSRIFFMLASIFGALGVSLGAYGAHGGSRLIELHQAVITYGKAWRYNMVHVFALIAIAWALEQWPKQRKLLTAAGWLQVAGIVLFSGSLYIQSLSGMHLGYITPAGGIAFVGGWLLMAWAVWKEKEQ